MSQTTQFCELSLAGQHTRIEYAWVGNPDTAAPLMVLLHEGLGSLSMWRDFPARLCQALGWRGLVYSRPGYGQSTPRSADEHWQPDFMHHQALTVLPALLAALDIDTTRTSPWLFGHSDGGSIALIHAAHCPGMVAGLVVLAPHIFVEDVSVASIELARQAYLNTDLKVRLAKHHADPDSAFWGWNDVWLSDAFRSWDIRAELGTITCPVLAVQGLDDEYGTLAQIRGIQAHAPHTGLLELPACGHSPHKDQPQAVIDAVCGFAAEASL
jgi:pimeloyl-ACP methyl ester carboxylesterase